MILHGKFKREANASLLCKGDNVMMTVEKQKSEKELNFSNMTPWEALLAFRDSFTKEEIDDLVHNMEEIERGKLTLCDDLRARYKCDN